MFFDWLGREGGALMSWWLLSLLAAIAAYPLIFRLMRGLPGRGYALARAAGLMLVGFVYWLLNNLGLLVNSPGSTVTAWLLVLVISAVSYATWREREPLLPWLRRNMALIVTTEALFVALFVGWAAVRALNPDLTGTEKPMEMAFLSAVRRSAQFPPHDPWLSGYAISYYHFGYIIMGTLANMSGVGNGVAFNLGIALLFALTGVGAFGVAYELVAARAARRIALAVGLLALTFVILMGNLGTVLVEIPYQTQSASAEYLAWMNIEERDRPNTGCVPSGSLDPATWCFWWWFRHSRVVRDLDLGGTPLAIQPITEFPNFSFVLADMHPHVLALPWAMLSIALAFNLVMGRRKLHLWELLLYAIFVGGMIFLNSWDAVYLGLLIGAEALRRLIANGTGWFTRQDWLGIAGFGGALAGLTAVLYLPFFLGFRSQAGGLVPNVLWPTQFQQFFVMFGPFVVILAAFLAAEAWRARGSFNGRFALNIVLFGAAFAFIAVLALAVIAWSRPEIRFAVFQTVDESGGFGAVLPAAAVRRLHGLLTQGLLALAIFVVIARLFAREPRRADGTPDRTRRIITYTPSTGFALLLVAAGAVLALAPDFVYLRDGFGVRINTLFKLYYQAWLMWSIASAYAVWSILAETAPLPVGNPRPGDGGELNQTLETETAWRVPAPARAAFSVAVIGLVGAGLVYPIFAVTSRAFKEGGHLSAVVRSMTLDGGPSLAQGADDYAVIQCLAQTARSDSDVVAEATRARLAYRGDFGRVSALTGIPTLLGWDNHQGQWRGDTFAAANTRTYFANGQQRTETRAEAIATLYNTTDVNEALGVIRRYGITYIYVGPTERREFAAEGIAKFEALPPVCRSGTVAVYAADSFGLTVNATN